MTRKKSTQHLDALIQQGMLRDEKALLKPVIENFQFKISDTMLGCIDKNNAQDPIAKQFLPTQEELTIHANDRADPIGDHTHSPRKGIVHRYPDRCLLMPVQVCAVYCRFCFRKEKVGQASQSLSPQELDAAMDYISQNKNIWEVILTGGDPLILNPAMLNKILEKLCAMAHVQVLRIHTRIPIVEPARIHAQMLNALRIKKPLYLMVHANHPQEFSEAAKEAIHALHANGIVLLSQTTLLKEINDDIETLSALMRTFVELRIKPYYVHHADLVPGTKHFRTSIAQGQKLMRALRGRISGLCQPTYVLDIPGGFGKMPIGPIYLRKSDDCYQIEDYQGVLHDYPFES